jgi:uncharacterized protein with NAD-binding domain and iron-sulfur cluster
MLRAAELLLTLVTAAQSDTRLDAANRQSSHARRAPVSGPREFPLNASAIASELKRLVMYGMLATTGGIVEGLKILQIVVASLGTYGSDQLISLLDALGIAVHRQLDDFLDRDDEARRVWEIVDLNIAIMVGIVRFDLLNDPRGFDAIDDYECLEWLRLNGASERSLSSPIIHGLYDLPFGYEGGDYARPRIAAGQAIRGALRMFFTYRGSLFWKMKAGMGDVVLAPFYEVLQQRGADFRFFHRLRNMHLATELRPEEKPYIKALEFDVQAEIINAVDYKPLINVRGLPCWPSLPDFGQLRDGEQFAKERRDFESHWDDGKVATKALEAGTDFDCVVLAVGLGAVPYVCRELIEHDCRWRDLVTNCKTVATQAFQLWMREDMEQIANFPTQVTVSGFMQPFDSWADMRQVIDEESWSVPPRAVAYFCSALPDAQLPPQDSGADFSSACRQVVRANAIRFLNKHARHLWPGAANANGFRWELLMDPSDPAQLVHNQSAFDSQFWIANVNPSDRYSASTPGSIRFRISPLDNTYDNLTVAGDWTACGFNEGCVEAAFISGRLAAHAIAGLPKLDDIAGYDHP